MAHCLWNVVVFGRLMPRGDSPDHIVIAGADVFVRGEEAGSFKVFVIHRALWKGIRIREKHRYVYLISFSVLSKLTSSIAGLSRVGYKRASRASVGQESSSYCRQ